MLCVNSYVFGMFGMRIGLEDDIRRLVVLGIGVKGNRFEIVVVNRNSRWQQES